MVEITEEKYPDQYLVLSKMKLGKPYSITAIEAITGLSQYLSRTVITFLRLICNFKWKNETYHIGLTQTETNKFVYTLNKGRHNFDTSDLFLRE